MLLSCSGEMRRIPASPSLIRSNALARSGIESRLFTVTQLPIPRASSPATWSDISATNGEITTVSAPVLSYRDRAGTW